MRLIKNSPVLKSNRAMCVAGTSLGMAATCAAMTLVAFAESNDVEALGTAREKVIDLINQIFTTVQSITGPLFGLIALVCLVAMGICVLNNNSNGLRAWRAGLVGVLILLALVYVVPTLVKVASDFGTQVNGDTALSDVFSTQ